MRDAGSMRMMARLKAALAPPGRSAWKVLAIEAAWSLPLAFLLCAAGGLVQPGWTDDPAMLLRLALLAVVAPALGEELLFRVLLLPRPGEGRTGGRLALSTGLFVLWHPPQALLFGRHWADIVLDPWFLAAVAVMGVAFGRLYLRTGSVWPSVILHWATIMAWKAFLAGPSPWVS